MNNAQIAEIFRNIAGLLELQGDPGFKTRAYERAAWKIEKLPVELEQWVTRDFDDPTKIAAVGKSIGEKVVELVTTGRLKYYEDLAAEFPDGTVTLMNVPGIGPKTALLLSRELGISTLDALEKAILDGRLSLLPHLGGRITKNILDYINSHRANEGQGRT